MTSYRVTCPNCQSSAEVSEVKSRKPMRCSVCQTAFVPSAKAAEEIAEVAVDPDPVADTSDSLVGTLATGAVALLVIILPLAWFSLGSRSDELITISDHMAFLSFVSMVQLFFLIAIWWRSH